MAQAPYRSPEVLLAQLVHHMAEMVKTQEEMNRLLRALIQQQGR